MPPKNPDFKGLHIWGLTGGIASGKSLAAQILTQLGFPVIDADQVSRDLMSAPGGPAQTAVLAAFGTAKREELRAIVFADPAKRKQLETILHPLIQAESHRQLFRAAHLHPKKVAFYEATLLVEAKREGEFEGLIAITCPASIRQQRLEARSGFSHELAAQIIAAQISEEQRNQAATVVFTNTGTTEELRAQILEFLQSKGWLN